MGCAASGMVASKILSDEASKTSRKISKDLSADAYHFMEKIKMLLLGSAECGKSTFLKQIRILHGTGFPHSERLHFREAIRGNAVRDIRTLINAMRNSNIKWNNNLAELIDSTDTVELMLDRICDARNEKKVLKIISLLWEDERTKQFVKDGKCLLTQTGPYFFDQLGHIFDEHYIPSDQDIICCRIQTTGIVETKFMFRNTFFELYDVGGQRSERKKWIHLFDNVDAVLFVAALSDYDLQMVEDTSKNRMVDSLELFQKVCKNRWFAKATNILFLNKYDVFVEKVKRVRVGRFFKGYRGQPTDSDAIGRFFRDKFLEQRAGTEVFAHYTCATDTKGVKFIFDAVMTKIVAKNLVGVGLN